jgi:3-phenylpropionate/cinnamic acid dioxygenase small subunit
MDDATAITNLLYRYAEAMDAGDFVAATDLFANARITLADGVHTDAAGMLALLNDIVIIHADGTPRTRHVVTNPIINIDSDSGTATVRCSYTVMQQVDDGPLQVIVVGRYHDHFAHSDGTWRFAERDYSLVDLSGDTSAHLRMALG